MAQYHYPQVTWVEGERRLWNPIQGKPLKNRPEERVRLRIAEALAAAGWAKTRISTEESLRGSGPAGRTDLICYNRDFEPEILVECKAENVPISQQVAEQTARYNRSVEAPYLLMTNGRSDYWFKIDDGRQPLPLEKMPDLLQSPLPTSARTREYWTRRGFLGKAPAGDIPWAVELLNRYWSKEAGAATLRYLDFTRSPAGFPVDHYYTLFDIADAQKIAYTLFGAPDGSSRLVAVVNREGANTGLFDLPLEDANDTQRAGKLYCEGGPKPLDPIAWTEIDPEQIPQLLHDLYDQYH